MNPEAWYVRVSTEEWAYVGLICLMVVLVIWTLYGDREDKR